MRICILGGDERFWRFLDAPGDWTFCSVPEEGVCYDLAVLLPAVRRLTEKLRSRTLLLWEEYAETLLAVAEGEQVVSCGFAARNTLTLASLDRGRAVLTVQRELVRGDGAAVAPQDIPLPESWAVLPPEQQVMLAGLRLLLGTLP
ncbi:MAG: hypothetical protein ACI3W8_05635 [Oscillospiraceae bacterium]